MVILIKLAIFLTGGTGSLGRAFVPLTLQKYAPSRLVVYSRDEFKQWEMSRQFAYDKRADNR